MTRTTKAKIRHLEEARESSEVVATLRVLHDLLPVFACHFHHQTKDVPRRPAVPPVPLLEVLDPHLALEDGLLYLRALIS